MRNSEFGHLLTGAINSIAAYEAKTSAAVEMEFGAKLSIAPTTIQRYKSGQVPPEPGVIEFIAEEAIRRGFLNREWMERFLRSARYPAPGALIERLFPRRSSSAPAHIYQNLPAPTYNQFVMRAQAFADVLEGLRQRSAVVLITSLGGMGKTCLAREVAEKCISRDPNLPNFDAVVWLSDKEHVGKINLSVVLDEIARTLDYSGITSLAFDDKRYEVDQILRRQRVLLVIDNFETITDSALLSWLIRLPEPSKALVTSREYYPEFRSSWPVDLHGMSKAEASEFILNQLRFLRMETLVTDPALLEPLCEITGGNPKAIMLALGYLKYGQRPLEEVMAEICCGHGNLFDDLFERAWELINDAARRILMAMTLFPLNASEQALSEVSGVQGLTFRSGAERLGEISLLDMSRPNIQSLPRYSLHPLVRSFARARLAEHSGFEQQARQRWLDLCQGWVEDVKRARYDLSLLKIADLEEATIEAAIWWCHAHDIYPEFNHLVDGMGYYYYVRGMWDKKLVLHPMAAEVARRHQDPLEEINALRIHIQVLCRQSNWQEADQFRPRLHELVESASVPDEVLVEYPNTESFYWLAKDDISRIEALWREHIDLAQTSNGYLVRSWQASCLLAKGQVEEALILLHISLEEVKQKNIVRGVIAIRIKLMAVALRQGKLAEAANDLDEISLLTAGNLDSQYYLSFIYYYYGYYYTLQANIPAAREAYEKAIDSFDRLGMRREVMKVRSMLRDIDEGITQGIEIPHLI